MRPSVTGARRRGTPKSLALIGSSGHSRRRHPRSPHLGRGALVRVALGRDPLLAHTEAVLARGTRARERAGLRAHRVIRLLGSSRARAGPLRSHRRKRSVARPRRIFAAREGHAARAHPPAGAVHLQRVAQLGRARARGEVPPDLQGVPRGGASVARGDREGGEARAILEPVSSDRAERVRYLDAIRFRQSYATDIVRWTADTLHELGVTVPIYANAYSGFGAQDWRALEAACDLAGPDLYASQEFRSGPEEHRRFLDRLAFTRTYSKVPYIPEFGAGIWHGWHYRTGVHTANHYVLAALSALAAGIVGWNWYMLVERDNWYGTPISGVARARPDLAPAFAEVVRLFREIDPPSLEKVTSTAITVDVVEQGARLDHDHPILAALHDADVDHECFDVDTGAIAKPLLFYAGGECLSRAAADRLASYVEDGGALVFVARLPRFDEEIRPANPLRLRAPDAVLRSGHLRRIDVLLGEQRVALPATPFASYTDAPGESIYGDCAPWPQDQEGMHAHATLAKGERHVVGYREARGKGSIVVLGVDPSPELVVALHA